MSGCSNHRYDTVDYSSIDPLLGNMEDFKKLVAEMDKRGMHLIMDGVFNHVGDDSIYFDRYGKYKRVGAYEFWSRVYDLMNDKGMSEAAAKEEAKKQLTAEGQVFSPYHWENWFEIKNKKRTKWAKSTLIMIGKDIPAWCLLATRICWTASQASTTIFCMATMR